MGLSFDPISIQYYNNIGQIVASIVQTIVLVVAIWGGYVAYHQVDAVKLFELLKFTQEEGFRQARRVVIRDICPIRETEWWNDKELEICASNCCANYDILAKLLQFSCSKNLQKFFINHWHDSIIRTYIILDSFIVLRRASGGNDYFGYEWLKDTAVSLGHSAELPEAKVC